MTRTVITGGPRTGKTTLAATLPGPVRHTDDLIGVLDWSDASAEVARWMDEPGPWVIEGVAASRALRKWRDQHPGEPPPVDVVVYMDTPRVERTQRQDAMAKGVASVHEEIVAWLTAHGVRQERQ